MGLFSKKETAAKAAPAPMPVLVDCVALEVRPCIVGGKRRAIFHRWINSAHPVPPRGAEVNENTRFFQYRRVEALVEYEDGRCDRVFPTEIKFVDGGAFDKFDWSGAESSGKINPDKGVVYPPIPTKK